MRIRKLHIQGEYKNLKDFNLEFDGTSFIDVLVGKNGTGKSNLFEAIIEVFRHLFEDNYVVPFDYMLQYEIGGATNEITWAKGTLSLNGKDVKSVPVEHLPENILIYYSGHNERVHDLITNYEEAFKSKVKTANIKDVRTFFGIGKEYKSLLLAILLLQNEDNKAKKFIKTKLGIQSLGSEIKIKLKRPFYANRAGFDVDRLDPSTAFWKPEGISKSFLDILSNVKATSPSTGTVRDEGYINGDEQYNDGYILYLDIPDFLEKFKALTVLDLFKNFDNLKLIEMLDEVSVQIKLENGKEATINHFSDGQFQSVYIYAIVEIFKERNCITLLDEPDSFLHPEWQYDFLKQVFDISEKAGQNNHVILSSHSAVTLVPHSQKKIKLFHFVGGSLECHDVSKAYAISQMSDNLMKYSENEQLLSILHSINIENKPVFFTEGSTDPIILKTAWDKLYKTPIPFVPIMAMNCVLLRSLLQDERIINELGKKPMFGLFDYDEAYNEWNYLKGKVIEADPYKGLIKEIDNKASFAFMLPVPPIADVQKQVMKNSNETFLHESRMAIEHLFYDDATVKTYFQNEPTPGGGSILVFNEKSKTKFAKEIVPTLDAKHFEVFRPLLEFVKSKC